MRIARAFSFVFLALAICVSPFARPLMAQDDAPPAEPETTEAPIDDASSEDADEPNAIRRLEKQVDEIAGVVVDGLAFVLFYEIIGREEITTSLGQEIPGKEDVAKFVEQVADDGLDPQEVDYSLVLGSDNKLGDDEIAEIQSDLSKEFTAGRTRSFSVSLGESDTTTYIKAVKPGVPIVVLWLVLGAIFFTLRMGFINIRGFKHAILVTAGKFDNHEEEHGEGEVSHFQALTAALSATVGLGNIAGVAIAVAVGGPGATFWMVVAGLLGMSSKFTECTLGQKYREVRSDGKIMGGAMYYLSKGLGEMGLGGLGQVLAVVFALMCICASFGGGNAFQVNQSLNAVVATVPSLEGMEWVYGLIMTVLVAIVILGGISRIAATAEKIVPFMCGVYVLACLWILLTNAGAVPGAIQMIVTEAFSPQAGYGALIGVLIQGFRRAAFSNEAGVGSAAIAHSAAKTEYPVREGIVALLEPFIDTVVVCSMTALVIVITGAYDANANPQYAELIASSNGAGLTSKAMGQEISWFPVVLSIAVVMFAYSTMISWSYYGERCWVYLFGDRSSLAYRIVFLAFVFLGSIMSAGNVLAFSDLMILGMAFPNILGVALLSGKVKRDLDEYWGKLNAGEFNQTASDAGEAGNE